MDVKLDVFGCSLGFTASPHALTCVLLLTSKQSHEQLEDLVFWKSMEWKIQGLALYPELDTEPDTLCTVPEATNKTMEIPWNPGKNDWSGGTSEAEPVGLAGVSLELWLPQRDCTTGWPMKHYKCEETQTQYEPWGTVTDTSCTKSWRQSCWTLRVKNT